MAFAHLRDFIDILHRKNMLVEIKEPVSAELEIAEICDRTVKRDGPALLFTNVTGHNTPVLINAFGSAERMAMALGMESLEEGAGRIAELATMRPPGSLKDGLSLLGKLAEVRYAIPKKIESGRCQEIVSHTPDLDKFPILKCWPMDGGRFITLPLVFTQSPDGSQKNVGMYRMQVYDGQTTGMHWHQHKVGASHYNQYKERGERMPVSVVLGGDPALIYAASAPLPDMVDEMMFAGFLRKKSIELVKCITNDIYVPADAEIVIEGYVDPDEALRTEGPFGDHTGYYSLEDEYPVFHVTAITHAHDPVYPTIIVGKPPQEDAWLGKATERLFLPLLQVNFPEIVDMNLPVEGGFHNLALVSIKKSYAGHARKVAYGLWGMGQMMLCKTIIVCDGDCDVQNPAEVLWRVGNNVAPQRDAFFLWGPMDALDHTAEYVRFGSKMGIDATRKLPNEGQTQPWPPDIVMNEETVKRIDEIWDRLGIAPQ
jgi:4-hydroxy-3-polyprenylbenzoate decarboxylase